MENLINAIIERNYKKFKLLYNDQIDINKIHCDQALIHYAAEYDSLNIVKFLSQNGASINQVNIYGETPLHKCIWHNRPTIAKYLIKKGCDINIKDSKGKSPLYYAVKLKRKKIRRFLIVSGSETGVEIKFYIRLSKLFYYFKRKKALILKCV